MELQLKTKQQLESLCVLFEIKRGLKVTPENMIAALVDNAWDERILM